MKFASIVALSMGVIFAVQAASVPSDPSEQISSATGYVEIVKKDQEGEMKTIDKKDVDFYIDDVAAFETVKPISDEELWDKNFETAYVLMEVKRNQNIFEQAAEVLRYPFQTSEDIQSISTPDQYEKIRIRVETSSTIVPEDKMIFENHEELSTDILGSISNSIPQEIPTGSDQSETLTISLNDIEYDPSFQHQDHEIHSRKNPTLVTTFDDLSKSIHEAQPNLSPNVEQNLVDFVARYVAKELEDVIEKTIEPETEVSNNSPSTDHPNTTTLFQSVDYTIPGIDKNLLDNLQGPVDQTWKGTDYKVRFKRNLPDGDVELWWKKGNDNIYLHAFTNGAADQNWGFGDVHIGLFRDEDRNQIQVWDFGDAKLEYIRDKNNSEPHRIWEFDNKDEASYWKYRHFIKVWCNANDFFIGKDSCIIY